MAKRAFRCMLLLALAAAPASAAQPKGTLSPTLAPAEFAESFARFAALPPASDPAAHAVDLSRIDPPLEPTPSAKAIGSGVASYYGRKFHGRRTASGEAFDMNAMTAAHRTLPFGSLVQVTNRANGRSVTVRINDRGPFHGGRIIDVSRAAATELGLIGAGRGTVELSLLEN